MTIDLWMLVSSGLLIPLFIAPIGYGRLRTPGGLEWGMGNRDSSGIAEPEWPDWIGRCDRAQKNLQESLPLFAILILVAHVAGKTNYWTGVGAVIFFVARIAHALSYTLGMIGIRTLFYYTSLGAMFLILSQLFR